MFLKEHWEKLVKGIKTVTIRYGRVEDYKEGDIVYIHCGGYVLGEAIITKVEYKKFSEITDEEAFLEGYPSKKKLKDAIKKHYPNIKANDIVTVIHFKWKKLYEKPISSEEFAWKGIMMDPVKIAKLALENLELTEKQKKYLNILIEEGSIRKAAMRLGGLRKRIIFRRILRKALEELIKRNIIKS